MVDANTFSSKHGLVLTHLSYEIDLGSIQNQLISFKLELFIINIKTNLKLPMYPLDPYIESSTPTSETLPFSQGDTNRLRAQRGPDGPACVRRRLPASHAQTHSITQSCESWAHSNDRGM